LKVFGSTFLPVLCVSMCILLGYYRDVWMDMD
jgi:hypothetical protein